MSDKQYFTLVFEGDARAFKTNPMKTETPFGVPVAVGTGNAFDKISRLEEDFGREWFWRIVDANGLADLPSDEEEALRLILRRGGFKSADPHAAWEDAYADAKLPTVIGDLHEVEDFDDPEDAKAHRRLMGME